MRPLRMPVWYSGEGGTVRALIRLVLSVVSLGVLCGCGTATTLTAKHSQRFVLLQTPPAHIQALVARNIETCWFDHADPIFRQNRYISNASSQQATDANEDSTIVIYEVLSSAGRTAVAYKITFEPQRGGTVVTTENRSLSYALAQKLSADVGYWMQGRSDCYDAASVPRGSF